MYVWLLSMSHMMLYLLDTVLYKNLPFLRLIDMLTMFSTGTNLEDGPKHVDPFYLAIPEAVTKGLLNESTVRESVKPLFYTRMRLGLFDPPAMNPYAKLDPSAVVQSEDHRRLSLETAMRSFVLLKNSESFLPLKWGQKFGTVAVSRVKYFGVSN